jgi:hypothetical protein
MPASAKHGSVIADPSRNRTCAVVEPPSSDNRFTKTTVASREVVGHSKLAFERAGFIRAALQLWFGRLSFEYYQFRCGDDNFGVATVQKHPDSLANVERSSIQVFEFTITGNQPCVEASLVFGSTLLAEHGPPCVAKFYHKSIWPHESHRFECVARSSGCSLKLTKASCA